MWGEEGIRIGCPSVMLLKHLLHFPILESAMRLN